MKEPFPPFYVDHMDFESLSSAVFGVWNKYNITFLEQQKCLYFMFFEYL